MSKIKRIAQTLGPGFLVAATGVGAGDMIAATVAGSRFGVVILWTCVLGAVFKYILNEGIARWQLQTKSTVISGWVNKYPGVVSWYFIGYLLIWSFIVAGALMAACGLVAHTIFPNLSIATWGIIHSIFAVILVIIGKYRLLENLMKFIIFLMFSTVILNVFFIDVDWPLIMKSLVVPKVPSGSVNLLLGVIGGIGGSVTMLCYNYWIKEKGWNSITKIKIIQTDLKVAYFLTAIFGIAIIILASSIQPELVGGSKIILALADKLGKTVGIFGKSIFLIGFWGAVFSSMLGVWNGVPYIFNDLIKSWKEKKNNITSHKEHKSEKKYYTLYLLYLAFPPIVLLFLDKPIWIIILYAIVGAFFMPFLALLLLLMNNSKWVKRKNNTVTNGLLLVSILLFLYLLILEIQKTTT